MSEPQDFEGFSFLADETFTVGPSVELVPVYRNERFAAAIGLAEGERDSRTEFVLIPGGSFRMGLDAEDLERFEALDEECEGGLAASLPPRDVTIEPFLLARTLLTQEVWDGLAQTLGIELWDQRFTESPFLPVHGLTWAFFDEVAEALALRLPTEAEWEYAARAGSSLPFAWGSSKHPAFEHAWFGHPHEGGPMGVAQKRPNGFGLFDIAGNVWELCADHWHDNYHEAPTDQSAWLADDDPLQRVMRGGSYRSETLAHLLCAFRSSAGVYFSGDDLGIRPAARLLPVEQVAVEDQGLDEEARDEDRAEADHGDRAE